MTEKFKSIENYHRVTEILYPFSGMDKIKPDVLANAARRGTEVHKICESIVRGLGEHGITEETEPYIDSFYAWWDEGHDVIEVEKRFFCDKLNLTGQCDLIIKSDDGLAIVDFKTSYKPSKTWPIQGAAYAYLARVNGLEINKIYFIHLKKTGKPAKVYEYPINDSFFFSIYAVWEYFYKGTKR